MRLADLRSFFVVCEWTAPCSSEGALPQLNLRDRIIEVTVACIGGGPTSADFFDRVGEWRPRGGTTFHDCELALRLVRADGEALGEIDGIVLALDVGEDAETARRRAVDMVHGRDVPVVVETRVDGEDVMDTLQRTVDAVMENMRAGSAPVLGTAPEASVSKHPLLAALQQVLQSTVSEHIAALEERLVARIERRLDRLEEAAGVKNEVTTQGQMLAAELKELRRTLSTAAQTQQRVIEGVATDVRKLAAADASSPVPKALESLRERIDAVLGNTREVAVGVQRSEAVMARRVGELRESLDESLNAIAKESAERDATTQASLTALIEESKKKKGWFT